MLGALYLILVVFFGCTLIVRFCNVNEIYSKINPSNDKITIPELLFIIPAGSTIGILVTTFICYFSIYIVNSVFPHLETVSYSICISICSILFLLCSIINLKKAKRIKLNHSNYRYYLSIILLLIVLSTYVISYAYFMRKGILYTGPTIESDLSPHTALTEAFGKGNNIPTNYPHFSNDGIRYHFLFFFFTGLLKFLGMRLDLALNIPSIIGLVSGLTIIGLFAVLLANRKNAFFIAPLLVLFRSSFAMFDLIRNKPLIDLIPRIIENNDWFHTTPYDEWGLWAVNVYANQRHLMFATTILIVIVMLFIPSFKNFIENLNNYKKIDKIKFFLIDKSNWIIKDYKLLVLGVLVAVTLPYFHASVLIALLLILFGMALFSENRLIYLIIAIISVVSTYVQTTIYSSDVANIAFLKLVPGFIVEKPSLSSILGYLFVLTGLTFILGFIYIFKKRKNSYIVLLSLIFLFPLIFAFLFQLSIDIIANHKFVQITILLFDIFVAAFVSDFYSHKVITLKRKVIGIILIILLTGTGVCEWFIYTNMNRSLARFNESSKLAVWVEKNTDMRDTFLTPYWSLNSLYMTGRQVYYGWPYYAWTAGHNTDERKQIYEYLLTGCNDDISKFIEICKKEHIKYFIDTPEYYDFDTIDENNFHREYITSNLKLVKSIPSENINIYLID